MSQELPAPTAITNLLFRYAELIDAGDYEGIGELLAHCTVTSDQGGEWTGAEAITQMYYDFTRKHEDGTPRTKHVITNPIVEVDGDTGTCRAYYTVFMSTPTLAAAADRQRPLPRHVRKGRRGLALQAPRDDRRARRRRLAAPEHVAHSLSRSRTHSCGQRFQLGGHRARERAEAVR